MQQVLLALVIIILIGMIIWKTQKDHLEVPQNEPIPAPQETEGELIAGTEPTPSELDYSEAIKLAVLDPKIRESHDRYTADIAKYSSGAGYTSVAEENRTATSVNWIAFSRPRYIPRRKGLLEQLSEDERMYYGNRPLTW